jgi:hypothetical protein
MTDKIKRHLEIVPSRAIVFLLVNILVIVLCRSPRATWGLLAARRSGVVPLVLDWE